MRYQIANNCIQTFEFHGPAAGQTSRRINFSASTIRDNVHVLCLIYYGTTLQSWGTLTKNQTAFHANVTRDGHVKIICALKTQLNSSNTTADNPTYDLFVGVGDGTGEDFIDTNLLGADVKLTFLSEYQDTAPVMYGGATTQLDYREFGDHYIVDIGGPQFGQSSSGSQAIEFSIDHDTNGKEMFEASIWIHLFDNHGYLQGVVKKVGDNQNNASSNNTFRMNTSGGFRFLPLIAGQETPAGSGKYVFQIGDPKKDAEVQVDEP